MVPNHETPAPGAPRLIVDHELLARLGPESTAAEWESTLRRTGLWDLPAVGSDWGRLVRAIRLQVERARDRSRLEVPKAARPALTLLAVGLALLIGLRAGPALGLLALGLPLLLAVAWFGPGRAADTGPPPLESASALLRQFLQRTVVDAAGEIVVENLPHREYLALRLQDLDDAQTAAEGRLGELAGTAERIRHSNRRLGRTDADPEIRQLEAAHAEGVVAIDRTNRVRAALRARLAALDVHIEQMRALAERRALSHRAARLTDEGEENPPLRTLAEVEVDVVEIEAELAPLTIAHREHEGRLQALLELLTQTSVRRGS